MVISISTAVLASLVAFVVLYMMGLSKIASVAFAFLGIAGIGGLGPLIFGKDKGKVTCDERDQLINTRAALAGFAGAYLVTGVVCMLPFSILGPQATIPVTWLPMIFMVVGLTSFFVHSVTILVQYGWRGKNHE